MAEQAVPRGGESRAPAESGGVAMQLSLIVATLSLLGIVMIASASMPNAVEKGLPAFFYASRQAMFCAVAVALCALTTRIPLVIWERAGPLLLCCSAFLLLLVWVPGIGVELNGSHRWIRLHSLTLQPSELVKVFWIVYLSGYLVRRNDHIRSRASGFFKPIALLAVIASLLLLEPDFGATAVLFAVSLLLLFLAGVPFLTFMVWGLSTAAVLGLIVIVEPYRVARLMVFLDPFEEPYGAGFQLTQSLIAIGRGDIFGAGLGQSVQKLFYLPEAHNDFLFAVLAEELGLVAALVTIALFLLLFLRSLQVVRMAERQERFFAVYLASGIALLIVMQAFVNIGVNIGLLPTKGLNLPFMSAGGSSLLANFLALGLLLRIALECRREERDDG